MLFSNILRNYNLYRGGVTGATALSSLFSSVGLTTLWLLFNLAELCSLFALINIPLMPSSLIALYQGMSFYDFFFYS